MAVEFCSSRFNRIGFPVPATSKRQRAILNGQVEWAEFGFGLS